MSLVLVPPFVLETVPARVREAGVGHRQKDLDGHKLKDAADLSLTEEGKEEELLTATKRLVRSCCQPAQGKKARRKQRI